VDPAAWARPETRRSFAAYRRGALRWFAGGLVGVTAAIGLSAYAVQVLKRPGLGVFIVAAVILGLLGLIIGGGGLVRAQRFRRVLQRAPWQRARLRVAGPHLRLVFSADAETAADADRDQQGGVDVRLMTTSRWRVRAVVGYRDGEVLLCPAQDGRYVLTAQGMNNLYGLLPLERQPGRYRP
jgi:hypothetical protein